MGIDHSIGRLTLVDEVANRLRAMIYAGEIGPGERLRMRELQQRFGVSHIPIREALRTLEGEGLVENQPQKGAVASPVSLELLGEVYDARRLLEPPLAVRALTHYTKQHLSELSAAYKDLTEAEGGSDDFYAAHRRFHWLTLSPGATPTLERIVTQLWGVSERFVRISKTAYPQDVEVASTQHATIFERCRDGSDDIAAIIERHLHVTEDVLRKHYAEYAATGEGR